MPDFLDEKRQEIAARLKELKPLVEEYGRLEAAASALDGVAMTSPARNGSATSPAPSGRGRGRPRGSKTASASEQAAPADAKRSGGRRRGSGTRAAQAFALVQEHPGITIPELANRMGIKHNYLYSVLPALKKEGKVSKKDRGWHPAGAA